MKAIAFMVLIFSFVLISEIRVYINPLWVILWHILAINIFVLWDKIKDIFNFKK